MRTTLPENGYESPRGPDTPTTIHGNGTHRHGERRRAGIGGSGEAQIGLDHPQSQAYLHSKLRDHQESGDEKVQSRKVGFRGRIGCYTWTWFTMTMATGGIANVLHASE
jgi:hypothetical protein